MTTKQYLRSVLRWRLNDVDLQQSLASYGGMSFNSREEKAEYIDAELDSLESADALDNYLELYLDISEGSLQEGNANIANSIVAVCLGITLTAPSSSLTIKSSPTLEETFGYFYVDEGSNVGSDSLISS